MTRAARRLEVATRRVRAGVWRALDGYRTGAYRVLPELEKEQWLSPDRLEDLRTARITRLLRWALREVPFYRERALDAALDPDLVVRSPRSFESLPPLGRSEVRSAPERLVAAKASQREFWWTRSGGSTGQPVAVAHDLETHFHAQATKWLFDRWSGYEVGKGRVGVWGSERDLLVGRERFLHRLGRWLRSELWVNSFSWTPEQMTECLRTIDDFRPHQLLGYAESLDLLAVHATREGIRVRPPGVVMSSAGTLSTEMRDRITHAFGAQVLNRYGTREVGDIACQCAGNGLLHVCEPVTFLEVVDEDFRPVPPGEVGEVLVTTLRNFTMPLIRYRIGDTARSPSGPCGCGRHWMGLENVTGRSGDAFRLADGRVVVPEFIIHMLGVVLDTSLIWRYQAVQRTFNHVEVRIVYVRDPTPEEEEALLGGLEGGMQAALGPDCRVTLKRVPEIPVPPSGKARYVLSEVPSGSGDRLK